MNTKKRRNERILWATILLSPTIIYILIMNVWPILQTLYFSFNDIQGLGSPKWIGFSNYIRAFSDENMGQAFLNTFVYTIVTVPVGTALSLLVAVLLNGKIKGKSTFRVLFFIPVVSAPAAIAMVWRWLYNSEYGLINYFLSFFGVKGPNWIGDSHYVLIAIMVVGIWSGIGYNMILFLGGLQDIPKTYYEAADIDGASGVDKFFNVTLPLLSPTLFFVLTTSFISALQVFDLIFMMVDKANPSIESAQSIVYLFYKATFVSNEKGYGAAIAVILLFIIAVCTIIQMELQKKWVHYK